MRKSVEAFLWHLAYLFVLLAWLLFDVRYLAWVVGAWYLLRIAAMVILYAVAGFPAVKFAKANLPRNTYLGFVALDILILALGQQPWLVVLEAVLAVPEINFYYKDEK